MRIYYEGRLTVSYVAKWFGLESGMWGVALNYFYASEMVEAKVG